jgi:hypothetical protein
MNIYIIYLPIYLSIDPSLPPGDGPGEALLVFIHFTQTYHNRPLATRDNDIVQDPTRELPPPDPAGVCVCVCMDY